MKLDGTRKSLVLDLKPQKVGAMKQVQLLADCFSLKARGRFDQSRTFAYGADLPSDLRPVWL
jgi:hypothetical protein